MYIEVTPTTEYVDMGLIDGNGSSGDYADGMIDEFQLDYLDGNYDPVFDVPGQDGVYGTFGVDYLPGLTANKLQKIPFARPGFASVYSFVTRYDGCVELTIEEAFDHYLDGNIIALDNNIHTRREGDGAADLVDGNAPSVTVYPSIVYNGNTVHLSQVEEMGAWDLGNHNLYLHSDLVQAYDKDTPGEGLLIFHGDTKYLGSGLPVKCNIAFADPYKNYNILADPNPPLRSIPPSINTVEPWFSGIIQYEMEACTMLKGTSVYKLPDGDYYIEESNEIITSAEVLAGTHLRLMALASDQIYSYVQNRSTGQPYGLMLPEFVIHEAAATYTSVMSQEDIRLNDIPFTIYDNYIELNRTEAILKGPVSINGVYWWCTLKYITEVGSPFVGKYIFTDKIAIDDIDKVTMKSLQVMVAFNKIKTD